VNWGPQSTLVSSQRLSLSARNLVKGISGTVAENRASIDICTMQCNH
jgi:hypothetical protein